MLRSSNPMLREEAFNRHSYLTGVDAQELMTVRGTAGKALLLILFASITACATWTVVAIQGPTSAFPWAIGGGLGALVIALILFFKQGLAPMLAPIYALVKGTFLGAISAVLNAAYPGIVAQAVLLTLGIAIAMLTAYQSGAIRATPMFVKAVIAATFGIFIVYLISFGMTLFGARMPFLHDATPLGIGISVVILIVASMNLVLDFDLIERGAERGAPKYMEWFGAFALVVTLFWVYIESLRLIQKIRGFTRT